MVSKSMLESLLRKQLSYVPEPQPFYTFHDGAWRSSTNPIPAARTAPAKVPQTLHLITWNIDFMASHPRARMSAALNYLEKVVAEIPSSSTIVLHLQEMMQSENRSEQDANDLDQIADAPWVRERFNVTDIDSGRWNSPYRTVTLMDQRLSVARVSRLRFVSEYQRDALLVDVRLASREDKFLRLCNVHLDSSYGSMRPIQWKALANCLQNGDEGIVASIVAGDCNANQQRDRTGPQENGFKDAYLEVGGKEGEEKGATWGFQTVDWKRWGRQRLDKEVFWGDVVVMKLERIGLGVQVEDAGARKDLEEEGELPFATDHYGLMGEYKIQAGLQIASEE